MQRYRQDALYELQGLEARIASNKRSAYNTLNAKTAAIADAVLPSMLRRLAELREEVRTLPERPPYVFEHRNGNFACLSRTTPLTEAELEALEIPDFLRRS